MVKRWEESEKCGKCGKVQDGTGNLNETDNDGYLCDKCFEEITEE